MSRRDDRGEGTEGVTAVGTTMATTGTHENADSQEYPTVALFSVDLPCPAAALAALLQTAVEQWFDPDVLLRDGRVVVAMREWVGSS